MADAGALLLAERHRRSMNQEQMAALLGLTRQKVALLEAGQPGVAAETLLRILADLGVTVVAVPSSAPAEIRQQAERLISPPSPPA